MIEKDGSFLLIDSSIWIDYYRPKASEEVKRKLQSALRLRKVAICGLIAVEVLQGAADYSAYSLLQEDFLGLRWLDITQGVWFEAARLAAFLRQRGLAFPIVDITIAATAIYYKCSLWHRDEHFNLIAKYTSLQISSPILS